MVKAAVSTALILNLQGGKKLKGGDDTLSSAEAKLWTGSKNKKSCHVSKITWLRRGALPKTNGFYR